MKEGMNRNTARSSTMMFADGNKMKGDCCMEVALYCPKVFSLTKKMFCFVCMVSLRCTAAVLGLIVGMLGPIQPAQAEVLVDAAHMRDASEGSDG